MDSSHCGSMSNEKETIKTALTYLNSCSNHDLLLQQLPGTINQNNSDNCFCGDGNLLLKKNWMALLIMLAIVVTVTGNILVIMAVSLERKLQNATNYFLMSLAITDMLLGLLVMPIAMVTILYNYSWPFPLELCPIWIFLDVLFSTASIMHLCAISLDRYIAIRNPIHHSRTNSRARARVKIIAAWTISVGISMPVPVIGLYDHSKVFKDCSCHLTDNSFVLIGSFVAFFIPLVIMVVTYLLTISALQSQATPCLDQFVKCNKWLPLLIPRGSLSSERLFSRNSFCPEAIVPASQTFNRHSAQSLSNEQKASKVLGVVFFLFVVMWCPFFITNVLEVICSSSACNPTLMAGLLKVFVWVGYLSSAVNPLVYTLFNKKYRAAFARYMRCQYSEPSRPLQAILVNTIPPLAFQSSKFSFQEDISLSQSTRESGFREFSCINQEESLITQHHHGLNEMVSHV